jgi:hypothetical protein
MKNPNPECLREDCRFAYGGGSTTLAYKVNCLSCGKMWVGKSRLGETTYKEDVE